MSQMFDSEDGYPPQFNQDIRAWSLHSNVNLYQMFKGATDMQHHYSNDPNFGISPDYTPSYLWFIGPPFEPTSNSNNTTFSANQYFQDGLTYYFDNGNTDASNNLVTGGYNLTQVKILQLGLLQMLVTCLRHSQRKIHLTKILEAGMYLVLLI